MSHILVTGGAGFIGSHIVDRLLAEGHSVSVIDNLSSGVLSNLSKDAKFYNLDIRSKEARELLREKSFDVIVHTAAQMSVRVSMDDPTNDADINVVGLLNLLQAYQGKKQPFFVLLSTGGAIYGEQETFPATEEHPIRPESVYGLAKRVSELYLDLWKRQFGMKFCALRLANVYGPRQNPHGEAGVVAIFCEKLIKGETPTINGNGEQTRDFVYVADVANAVTKVVGDSVEGIFNIGTSKETSVNQLFQAISKSLESEIKPKHGEAESGEQMRSSIDYSFANKVFNWSPKVNFDEGCKLTAEWFKGKR